MDLQGARAIVTGGASGIGAASVAQLRAAGARVVSLDLADAPGADASVQVDVGDEQAVVSGVLEAVQRLDGLDVAVLSAGVGGSAVLVDMTTREWDRVMNVNLRGVWNCMKGELRQMVAQGNGAIVNCSSIGGLKGSRGRSAYSASKHAVIGLTRSAALDYAAKGIRINAVCPGLVNTPMAAFVTKNYDAEIVSRMVAQEPIGRFGEPEEIAAAVVWLCSPAASFMVGHAMAVDGGILAG